MKKRLIPVALLMGAMSANAQVGIGTATPNKSAELTVEATNRGLLIPNVSLEDTKDKKAITNGNVNSLLVFNTTTNTAITPGYYYWFVDKWQRLTADSDIPAIVVNNFENILHMDGDKVENLIKNIINKTEGNVIYEGDKLYYINNNGDKVEINFENIVKQHETVTVLAYDPATGVMTYSNEEGNAVTVDVKGAVKAFETVTSIAIDHTAGTITFVDEAGNPTVLALKDLVKSQETLTTLARVQAGKYTYTNEAGTAVDINVIGDITEVIKNKTDLDLYNILKQLVKVEQSLTSLIYNKTSRELIYTDENNATHNLDVDSLVKDNQYVTELQAGKNISVVKTTVDNTITYTLEVPTATKDVAGVVKPGSGLDIDADGNLTVNLETAVNAKDLTGNEKIVVTDGKGAVLKTTSLDINEAKLSLQNIGGTLNLTQLQAGNAGDVLIVDANGNIVWSAKDAMTTNELTLDGTDLVSTVNGVSSTVSLIDKLTTEMFQNGSVTAEKLGADAADQGKVPVVQADGTVVYQNIAAANVNGKDLSSANELLTVSLGAGVVLKDVELTINQDKFDLAQIGGKLQITQIQKGANETILVTDADGNISWVTKDSVVKTNETVTVLVKNANGTFTYYNEKEINADGTPKADAVGVTIDPREVTVKLNPTTNKYEFTNSTGALVGEIDANADSIAFDNSTNGFTSTNVQEALEELKTTFDSNKGDLVVAGGLEFTGRTNGTAKLLADAGIQIADGGVTTDKLDDKAVTPEKLEGGASETILVTDANGNVSWVTKDSVVTGSQTLTVLGYDIPTNSLLYKDEEEKDHKITLNSGSVTYDATKNELTYVGSDKSSTVITLNNTDLSYDKTNSILTYVNAKGGIQTIDLKTAIIENTTNALTLTGNKLTSTVNGVDASVELTEENVTSSKGITSTSITVGGESNGTNATLKNVTLEITPGRENQVLVTGADGKTAWVDQSNLSNVTLAGDVTGTAGANEISSLQGTAVDAKGQKEEGQVLTYQNGTWVPATPKVNAEHVANAKNLTAADGTDATIEVTTGGTNAVLVETSLRVKAESITSKEIKDGSIATSDLGDKVVTAEKLGADAADEGKVPVVQQDGSVVYQTISGKNIDGEALSSANNLLTVGGVGATSSVLKEVTLTVNEAEFNIENMKGDLAITRLEAGTEGQILTTVGTGDQAKAVWAAKDKATVVKGATGNVSVTQGTGDKANEYTVDVKAAMPKVFYMPPVMFDTSKKHNVAQTRNLYEEYVAMFGGSQNVIDTPIDGTRPGLVKNGTAENQTIPTFEANQLDFYVAYYDPAVFENVQVSDAGVLTYTIKKKAKYGAFMTVVFVVRDTPRQ